MVNIWNRNSIYINKGKSFVSFPFTYYMNSISAPVDHMIKTTASYIKIQYYCSMFLLNSQACSCFVAFSTGLLFGLSSHADQPKPHSALNSGCSETSWKQSITIVHSIRRFVFITKHKKANPPFLVKLATS